MKGENRAQLDRHKELEINRLQDLDHLVRKENIILDQAEEIYLLRKDIIFFEIFYY